nr:TonB-dependent receptor [Chitinophaga nivalis]
MKLCFNCGIATIKKVFLTTLILITIVGNANAGEILSAIKGKVSTSDGSPAAFVTVRIKNSNHGALTDQQGEFVIKRIKPGRYTLEISFLGYENMTQEVVVETDKITQLSLQLHTSEQQMKEIIITGNKHNKYNINEVSNSLRLQSPLVEIPQNIQVVTNEVLADQQIFDIQEGVTRNVSGAQRIGHWDLYANIQVRGSQITPFRNGMNVQISPWSPLAEDMSMVDRVEFVKGPAGFMLSNGEPGGLYNIVTKKPSGIEKGEVTLTLGSFETYRATADVDGKLSKNGKLLYRINVMGQLKGSHRDFEFNNRYSVVPVLKYLIDEQTSVTLEYSHQFLQLNAIGSNYAFSKRKYADLPRNFTTAEPNFAPTNIQDKSLLAIFEHQFNHRWKLTAQAAYFHYQQEGQSMWPTAFAANNDSLLQRNINIWDALGTNRTGQVFITGKMNTGTVVHNILAGVDLKNSSYFADWGQAAPLGDASFNIYQPQYGHVKLPTWDRSRNIRERGVQYNYGYNGFYLQDELGFFDNQLRITLAGRYTINTYKNPYSGNNKDEMFTPRAGVSYSFDKNTAVYFIYDKYFLQNPGMDWQKKSFKPLTGYNVEAGFKRDWLGGKWNSTLAVYRIIKNNMLVTDFEHPDPRTNQFIYSRQTGKQTIRGVELDVKGEIIPHLHAMVNYAYTDAAISADSDPKLVGNKVPGTATHIQNTWLSYQLDNGVCKGLRAAIGYQYVAGRVAGLISDKSENSLPDYFRLDGSLGYAFNKFDVNLLVNNLLDAYLYSGAPSGGLFYWQAEPGRNVRFSVGYKF